MCGWTVEALEVCAACACYELVVSCEDGLAATFLRPMWGLSLQLSRISVTTNKVTAFDCWEMTLAKTEKHTLIFTP